jgi:class 3 adenylate cyclase/dihydrofolate reductase
MRLVVREFMTLDGVMEAPGFEEHRDGRNGWALQVADEELQNDNREQAFSTDAYLFGRTTYNIWAAFWPTGPDAGGLKDLIDRTPKYVISKTLETSDWSNTTILRGDVGEEVARLKAQPGGDLVVYGSADLVDGLLERDLIDELRILLFPVILGSGKHLFRDGIDTHHLRLLSTRTFPSGAVRLTYDRQGRPIPAEESKDFTWTEEQVQSLRAMQDTNRVLATVLFTDIVDSTKRAAELGDREWRRLLDRHDQAAQVEVARWHGTLVKSTGDGILARFDAPTRALRCALALCQAAKRMGIEIRAAIHTGEVEIRSDDLGGIGVHIASRALSEAGPGDVIVTRTVHDLVTGTEVEFLSRGMVSLRGVPGEWELFAASLR